MSHSTFWKYIIFYSFACIILGVFSGLAEIVKRESFIALYKGNGAQMVRVFPYAAIQFTSFEFYKTVIFLMNSFIFNTQFDYNIFYFKIIFLF